MASGYFICPNSVYVRWIIIHFHGNHFPAVLMRLLTLLDINKDS